MIVDVRCKKCKKLLCRSNLRGRIEIKCSRCGLINVMDFESQHETNSVKEFEVAGV